MLLMHVVIIIAHRSGLHGHGSHQIGLDWCRDTFGLRIYLFRLSLLHSVYRHSDTFDLRIHRVGLS